jgi:hypothetical protein
MPTRMMVTLTDDEADALLRMADAELRDPREQLRLLLRQEARRRGLLAVEEQDGMSDEKRGLRDED